MFSAATLRRPVEPYRIKAYQLQDTLATPSGLQPSFHEWQNIQTHRAPPTLSVAAFY
jgi:hypothetical protein